jgi:hypothetical protein
MSPLDDQLRAAMHARADVLAPSPDPLAGIEARARGIKRRRAAASVAGAALAVTAVAFVVPALDLGGRAKPATFATQGPRVSSAYALDPAAPWAYRGTAAAKADLAAVQSAWAARHPGSTLTPLFGQVYEPAATAELAFVATGGSDGPRYGFVHVPTAAAPSFVYDEPLASGTAALPFALEGDEGRARLVVVAAPGVTRFEYAAGGVTYAPMTALASGVAIAAQQGTPWAAALRVTAPDGTVLLQGDAPDQGAGSQNVPANVLTSWPTRGTVADGPDQKALLTSFAKAFGRTPDKAVYRALYTGTSGGVRYTVGQAWFSGETKAYDVSYATGGTQGPAFFLGRATAGAPAVLAFVLSDLPGSPSELLVVVPQPRTGEISYAGDATVAFAAVPGWAARGVALIDRDPKARNDRLQVLDGNGDLSAPTYQGPVGALLCGYSSCG